MAGSHVAPDPAQPGRSLLLSSEDGPLELVIMRAMQDGRVVARAPRLKVREGMRLELRAHDERGAWRLRYLIDQAVPASSDEANVVLRLVAADNVADERAALRVPHELLAVVRPAGQAALGVEHAARTVDVSLSGVRLESERRFEVGQKLDVDLRDLAGTIALRVEVVAVERGAFGRHRARCRIESIDEHSALLLGALVERRPAADDDPVDEQPVDTITALRAQLQSTPERPRGLFRRRSA